MRLRSAIFGLLFAVTIHAQEQTGAPAGIPAPAPPPSIAPSITAEATPGAMTFRIRVLDGRNGMPIRNAHVKLWYDEPAGSGYEFATDVHGVGLMPAPVGEPLRVLASVTDYTDCRKPLRDDPPQAYNLVGIATSGIATENGCGRVSIHTQPGELVLFVRSPRWYEGLNRNSGN